MINLKRVLNIFNRKETERFIKVTYDALLRRTVDKKSLAAHRKTLLDGMPPSNFVELIANSEEFKTTTGYSISVNNNISKPNFFEFKNLPRNSKKIKNLIYFIPCIKKEIGGIKVIIRHIETINNLDINIKAHLFFPEHINTKLNWLDYSVPIKNDFNFDVKNDFIIIPEIWVLQYASILFKNNMSYAIFVQNGYDIFSEVEDENQEQLNLIKNIYNNASAILTISKDSSACISVTFPTLINKIIQLTTSIDNNIFHKNEEKKNIISYMPRKLSSHSSWIISQIKLLQLTDWKIFPIIGINEKQVGKALRSSKIFLSFSDREGLSLPPLEAALSGNKVIGYTGEGAKEYWSEPIFTQIEAGNLIEFLNVTVSEMTNLISNEDFSLFLKNNSEAYNTITTRFSKDHERTTLEKFLKFVATIE